MGSGGASSKKNKAKSAPKQPLWRDERFKAFLEETAVAMDRVRYEKGKMTTYTFDGPEYDQMVQLFKGMSEAEKDNYLFMKNQHHREWYK